MVKLCECGCGKVVNEGRRYILGHSNKGRSFTENHRRKMSEVRKGKSHPHKGKSKIVSEETKQKISESLKCHIVTKETKEKISASRKGMHFSNEHIKKLSESHKGKDGYWIGKKRSKEDRKKFSDAKKGEKSPNWKGGISFEPYCPKFNNEFKERVRNFFGRICLKCGNPENGRKLSVHHANYLKDACCDKMVVPLFVPLCLGCNSKVNYNREYWNQYFENIIIEKYNGQCYLPKEEMMV